MNLIAEIEERCARLRVVMQHVEPALDSPRDGEIRDGRVWMDGHGLYLTRGQREFLEYLMARGLGRTWEQVASDRGWKLIRKPVDNRIGELNKAIKAEMKGRSRWLHFFWAEEQLAWEWHGAAAKNERTA